MKLFSLLSVICLLFPFIVKAQDLPQQYREDWSVSWPNRKAQHLEIKAYVDKLLDEDIQKSMEKFKPDYFSIETYENSLYPYRKEIKDYYGYPPPGAKEGKITKFLKVGEDVNCTVYRVWVEVVDGVNAYGIYMVPKKIKGKAPLIIAQHGGSGNPEAICDIGTRVNYHAFGQEAVKRGYIVWAPALAMQSEYAGDPKLPDANRDLLDRKLKLAGTSMIGLELYKIIESTKALVKERPEIDASRIGMTGLSWGSFFTLYTTALCPFIKVAVPSASYRDSELEMEKAVSDSSKLTPDRFYFRQINRFQAVGLICPRPCLIQVGEKDPLLNLEGSKKEAARAMEIYKKLGIPDRFEYRIHPGAHEFENESIFRFFKKWL